MKVFFSKIKLIFFFFYKFTQFLYFKLKIIKWFVIINVAIKPFKIKKKKKHNSHILY